MERSAAEQGNPDAQVALGSFHHTDEGIPQDYAQAHMWFNLAAARGNTHAAKNRDIVAEKMTADQIVEAQRLASDWKPTK